MAIERCHRRDFDLLTLNYTKIITRRGPSGYRVNNSFRWRWACRKAGGGRGGRKFAETYGGKVNQRPPRDAADSLIAVENSARRRKINISGFVNGDTDSPPRVPMNTKKSDAARVNTWNPVCRVCVRDARRVITRKQRGQSGGNYF